MRTVTYLDNAATTPLLPEVLESMLPYMSGDGFGNPSSAHAVGQRARAAVDAARRQIADALGAEPHQVIFTGGGTEADNLAVMGTAARARDNGGPWRVAVSSIEHPGVRECAAAIVRMGGESITLPVDRNGLVDLDSLEDVLRHGAAVVSAMWVNNEVGIVQHIAAMALRCRAANTPFHTDAVQAIGKVPCRMDTADCTLLALSGHKMGGPQGTGALIVRDRTLLGPVIHGGGQQFGLRAGTENVPGIVGLGRAVELAVADLEPSAKHFRELRDELERQLLDAVPEAQVIGADAERAPHISMVAIPGIDSEAAVMHLDLAGVACSAGSACHTGSAEPSYVLSALDVPRELALRALRFSFYKQNTMRDVERVMSVLPDIVTKVRGLAESLGR